MDADYFTVFVIGANFLVVVKLLRLGLLGIEQSWKNSKLLWSNERFSLNKKAIDAIYFYE